MKSSRTKRRKIKNEIDVLLEEPKLSYNLPDDPSQFKDTTFSKSCKLHTQPSINLLKPYQLAENSKDESIVPTNIIYNDFTTSVFNCQDNNNVSSPTHCPSNKILSSPINDQGIHSQDIRSFLGSWAIQFNVPHNAINALLKGLKNHSCFNYLPKDSRTLLSTPKQISNQIRCVHPGSYYHFGLTAGILRYASPNSEEIKLAIGIDGLPISKSSGGQFWPIMAYIIDSRSVFSTVFPVGLYYGNLKPSDSNDYLHDFVNEARELLTSGIDFNGFNVKVSINVFCCDSPAKAFILKIKSHSGFSSCSKCYIEGEYKNNRVCFPYSSVKSTERTHQSYITMSDEDHHINNHVSILSELPNTDIVSIFSLDYMHLVCLGVMKKLLILWMSKGPLSVRIRAAAIHELSKYLLNLNQYIPSDFVRKARELSDVSRWKATEFRSFLLYFGPIVLKNILNEKCYVHFMALSISMTILLSPDRRELLEYANKLLDYFVKQFEIIYGVEFSSHNVHGLIHLCDAYQKFGPLDNCCAFKFENYMKELKSLIRKHEKPLEQVINRYSERNALTIEEIFNNTSNKNKNLYYTENPILEQEHNDGPLNENCTGSQYKRLFFKTLKIKIKGNADCFALTNNEIIIKCLNIIYDKGEVYLIGKYFKTISSLYNDPINSSMLNIYQVGKMSDTIKCWHISKIIKKMMVIEHNNQKIAMPIIHSNKD
ncbi:Uncharacterized protein FWK35_00039209 [Aphis craccivora]|uniref:DUF4806 domain-containing protein n=1 Tax=Aphis craccivora TaxID=307492 RepID=A0A6G0VRG5_APHCR|nr:Uncharacterized protein FWK35_00039209 [Aphis craccivora]